MDRRAFMRGGAGALGATLTAPWTEQIVQGRGSNLRFKYSICNEVFENWKFDAACHAIKAAGFSGVEIAPFTLAEHVDELTPSRRRELRDIMRSEGIEFAGLHWLLLTPKWLHVTTAEREIREKSWAYFLKLIDFCADLGKGIMVLGSPKQRASRGTTPEEAKGNLIRGLESVARHAGERGVTILVEALPRKDTDVVNTLDEAVRSVEEIRHPAIQTMFDFHNTVDEREPLDKLVRRHHARIRHVHVNEMDGRHPGTGNFDFLPVFRVLDQMRYSHWVSLEVFDFKAGAEQIARNSMKFFRNLEAGLGK